MFTRRTATVTMSAPEAACAWAITACEGYLPVPTMSREVKVRPAMTKGVSIMVSLVGCTLTLITSVAAADEIDDLDAVAVVDHRVAEQVTAEDLQVVFDRDAARIDGEPRQQVRHR